MPYNTVKEFHFTQMDKITFIALWDLYRGLLTPTQREITDLYFNLDLSPSEIAEQKGITRQGVSECLKTCKKQLEEYEEKLRFSAILKDNNQASAAKIKSAELWAENFKEAHPEFSEECTALLKILGAKGD